MPSARHQVTIRRPVGEVFAFVADGLNGPRWRSGITDIALVSGSAVGAMYKQGVKGPGGRRVDADYPITAHEPNARLAFEGVAGPVRPKGEYVFDQVADGTHLTFSLAAHMSGIKKLLMARAVQKTMDAEVRSIDRLKALLESTPEG